MLFNSLIYIVFFIIVLVIYYILPHRLRWVMLLIASLVFYMAWIPQYVLLILFDAFVGYIMAILIARAGDNRKKKKLFLVFALVSTFGILFFFKYLVFINRSLMALFGFFGISYPVADFSILLPMGISFHTFQNAGYAIDVYRGDSKPERNFFKYALFVMFFPQLVAGPIERAGRLIPALFQKREFKIDNIQAGVKQMLLGYFKKVVVADRLAVLVNTVYNVPQYHRGLQSLIATFFFAFQIYCDFSGYTDIALGGAKCLGIDLMQNFRQPYLSASVGEFWRRWHISLSTWFRDYLYTPLGGIRCSRRRQAFNIFITFAVSGLWHGADWTFVIWGLLHGLYQNIETWLAVRFRFWGRKRGRPVKIPLTFLAICFACIFFRANSVGDAFGIIGGLFAGAAQWGQRQFIYQALTGMGVSLLDFAVDIGLILAMIGMDLIGRDKSVFENMERKNVFARYAFYGAVIGLICCLGVFSNGQQFIYFQF
ncbi:MAG: MBOAT family protein [Defluviitaleaceae bacterium]|nr:MBOAT family protein [Defluviitaleaceae bacterium]